MKTIGDRIKEKRKEMGLTQLQLATRLGVTDRAVSKWEQNEGNPDFGILPTLAKELGMTLDYLISGVEPSANLEDMDKEKRAFYLIERDDAENFVKYGYPKPHLLFDNEAKNACGYADHSPTRFETKIRDAVYVGKKTRVFDALIKSYLTLNTEQKDIMLSKSLSSASLFYDRLDDFVILCALAGRTDILEEIGFKFFAIGKRDSASRTFRYTVDDARSTYLISEETLRFVLTDERIPEISKRYVVEVEFFRPARYPRPERIAFFIDSVATILYESKQFDLLKELLERMTKNATDSKKVICKDGVFANNVYFKVEKPSWNETKKIPLAVIPNIDHAIEAAKQNNDVEWLKAFSDYNVLIKGIYGGEHKIISQDELEMYRIKADPKSSYSEMLVSTYTRLGLIDFQAALSSTCDGLDRSNLIASLELALKNLKKNYDIIKDLPICYPELLGNMIEGKNMTGLSVFASDHGLITFQEAIHTGDEETLENWVRAFFSGLEVVEETYAKFGVGDDERRHINALLNRQRVTCPRIAFESAPIFGSSEYVKQAKTLWYEALRTKLEEKLEKCTQSKRREETYKRVSAEITPEFLLAKLEKGDEDGTVVSLCALLEATLQYRSNADGELHVMLDAYFKDCLQELELHNLTDDEDNNYYRFKKEDEETMAENQRREQLRNLLQKLRMRHNHIIHPIVPDAAITTQEIKQCINVVKHLGEKQ